MRNHFSCENTFAPLRLYHSLPCTPPISYLYLPQDFFALQASTLAPGYHRDSCFCRCRLCMPQYYAVWGLRIVKALLLLYILHRQRATSNIHSFRNSPIMLQYSEQKTVTPSLEQAPTSAFRCRRVSPSPTMNINARIPSKKVKWLTMLLLLSCITLGGLLIMSGEMLPP